MSILQRIPNLIKETRKFWLPLILVVIYFEVFFTILFWFRDAANPDVIDSGTLIDGPYLYYLDDFEEKYRSTYGLDFKNGIEKKEGTFRIFVTGSSAGMQIVQTKDQDGNRILEKSIQEVMKNNRIEVIDANIPAYTLEQEFIFAQLVLQKYAPDFIISINGYTDLSSFVQNRFDPTITLFPPWHYGNFKLVQMIAEDKSFIGRFLPLFKNNVRAFDYIYRRLIESQDYNDLSDIQDNQISKAAEDFYLLIDDYRDFLKVKDIGYAGFLQPLRYYKRDNPNHTSDPFADNNTKKRAAIYYQFENKFLGDKDIFSLTTILEEKEEYFKDPVHFELEGIKLISHKIASDIKKKIEESPSYKYISR